MDTPLTPAQRRIYQAAMRLFSVRGVTQLTVSELAEFAGVARGTIYNNISDVPSLFRQVATQLTTEMENIILARCANINDPALRLCNGIQLYVKRAHDEPDWGLFVSCFGLSTPALQVLRDGAPAQDLRKGMQQGRYFITPNQMPSVLTLLEATVIGAIILVRNGVKTWREAGATASEFALRALGITPAEANLLANSAVV